MGLASYLLVICIAFLALHLGEGTSIGRKLQLSIFIQQLTPGPTITPIPFEPEADESKPPAPEPEPEAASPPPSLSPSPVPVTSPSPPPPLPSPPPPPPPVVPEPEPEPEPEPAPQQTRQPVPVPVTDSTPLPVGVATQSLTGPAPAREDQITMTPLPISPPANVETQSLTGPGPAKEDQITMTPLPISPAANVTTDDKPSTPQSRAPADTDAEVDAETLQSNSTEELTPQQIFDIYLQSLQGEVVKKAQNEFPLLEEGWLEGLEELGLVEYVDGSGEPVSLQSLLKDRPVNDEELLLEIRDFVDLLEVAGLVEEICQFQNLVTVLAPYNDAMRRITVENTDQLADILRYHVVLVPPSRLISGEKVPTLKQGNQLLTTYERPDGRFTFIQQLNTQDEHGAFVHYLDGIATPLPCDAVFVTVDDNLDPSSQ